MCSGCAQRERMCPGGQVVVIGTLRPGRSRIGINGALTHAVDRDLDLAGVDFGNIAKARPGAGEHNCEGHIAEHLYYAKVEE